MKRVFMILMAVVMLAAGCAKAPADDMTAQKNTEQIISLASAEAAALTQPESEEKGTLAERIGAPEQLTWENRSVDGKLTVSIDAPVIVPEIDLPIIRVEAAEFTQETVDRIYEGLLGDMPMFEVVYQRTKSEVEALLTYYRSVLEDASASTPSKVSAQEYVDLLEAELNGAPESIAPISANSTFKRIPVIENDKVVAHYYGLDLTNADRTCYFSVSNDYDNQAPIVSEDVDKNGNVTGGSVLPVMKNAHISYSNKRNRMHTGYHDDTIRVARDAMLPEKVAGILRLTPAEAAAKADEILMRMGLIDTFSVADIYLVSDRYPEQGRLEPTAYDYRIVCTRRIDGIPCAYLHGEHGSGSMKDGAFWSYESIEVNVSDSGVSYVVWGGPLHILETVDAAPQLLPYSTIMEIAQKILPLQYNAEVQDAFTKTVRVNIDRVTLSLQRIVDKGELGNGLLIPVWNFFGTRTIERTDDFYSSGYFKFGSQLSINALDGSIIDPAQGY